MEVIRNEYLHPLNEFLYKLLPLAILIVAGCIIGVLIYKLYGKIEGRKIEKKTSGTTNKWFSWEEFYEWKKNKK